MFTKLILNYKKNVNTYPINIENVNVDNILNDDNIVFNQKLIDMKRSRNLAERLDLHSLLSKQIETKDKIIEIIKEICTENNQKQLTKNFFKEKLIPILNVNDKEFDYLFSNWIKKIILTFCDKNTQINLQNQLNNIITKKDIDVSILLSDYEFNDDDLLQFDFESNTRLNEDKETKQQTRIYKDIANIEDNVERQIEENDSLIQKDLRELNLVGLQNVGNTCYINSAIQCLYSCSIFISGLLHFYNKNFKVELQQSDKIDMVFTSLMNKMKTNQPVDNLTLNQLKKSFNQTGQQDSREFLFFVLQKIQFTVNKFNKITTLYERTFDDFKETFEILNFRETENVTSLLDNNKTNIDNWIVNQNIVTNNFGCYIFQDLTSTNSNYHSFQINKEIGYVLPLNNNDNTKLENVLTIFNRKEMLKPNNIFVGEQESNYNTIQYSIWKTNDYLVLPLKRIEYNLQTNQFYRNETKVDLPKFLDITNYIHINSSQKTNNEMNKYELISISWHGGFNRKNGGHYETWSKHKDSWFVFNDNKPIKKIDNPYNENDYIEDSRQKTERDYKWIANVVIYKRIHSTNSPIVNIENIRNSIQQEVEVSNENNKDSNKDSNKENKSLQSTLTLQNNVNENNKGGSSTTSYFSINTVNKINDELFDETLSLQDIE